MRTTLVLFLAFLGLSAAAFSALPPPKQIDPELRDLPRQIRRIEDIRWMCLALKDPRFRKMVPGMVVMKEYRSDLVCVGEIVLLNPADLSTPIGTYPFEVRWPRNGSPRNYEQDRSFSPYIQAGSSYKALFSELPDVTGTLLTKFPRTYMVPESWFPDALAIAAIEGPLENAKLPGPMSGLTGAVVATSRWDEKMDLRVMAELLKKGDPDLQTYVLMLLFEAKDTQGVLLDYINAANNLQAISSLALGLAAACNRSFHLEANDFPKTVKAIFHFAKTHPDESGELRKFLEWYREGSRR